MELTDYGSKSAKRTKGSQNDERYGNEERENRQGEKGSVWSRQDDRCMEDSVTVALLDL